MGGLASKGRLGTLLSKCDLKDRLASFRVGLREGVALPLGSFIWTVAGGLLAASLREWSQIQGALNVRKDRPHLDKVVLVDLLVLSLRETGLY